MLPEIAGHLALLATAPAAAHRATTLSGALAASALRRPLDVLRGVASTRTLAPKHAVLGALAPDGEAMWVGGLSAGLSAGGIDTDDLAGRLQRAGWRSRLAVDTFVWLPSAEPVIRRAVRSA